MNERERERERELHNYVVKCGTIFKRESKQGLNDNYIYIYIYSE